MFRNARFCKLVSGADHFFLMQFVIGFWGEGIAPPALALCIQAGLTTPRLSSLREV